MTYSTPEVMKLTGLTKAGVHTLVRRNQIRLVARGDRGGKANAYPAEDIQAAALLMGMGIPAAASFAAVANAHVAAQDDGSVVITPRGGGQKSGAFRF